MTEADTIPAWSVSAKAATPSLTKPPALADIGAHGPLRSTPDNTWRRRAMGVLGLVADVSGRPPRAASRERCLARATCHPRTSGSYALTGNTRTESCSGSIFGGYYLLEFRVCIYFVSFK